MFGFLKRCMGFSDAELRSPLEPVKPCENEPDISEPVTSFLKCFNSTPKRFKLVRSDTDSRRLSKYQFNDLETNESWKITIWGGGYHGCKIHDTNWMTSDEQKLIVKTITNYYIKRNYKRLSILAKRYARKMEKERSRLTAIYKED